MLGVSNNLVANNLNLSKYQSESNKFNAIKDGLSGANNQGNDKLKEASQNFEAVFINQLLQVMDKTIQRSEFMHGGQGEKIFREMFYSEIANDMASKPGSSFGLGKQIYDQLSKYE